MSGFAWITSRALFFAGALKSDRNFRLISSPVRARKSQTQEGAIQMKETPLGLVEITPRELRSVAALETPRGRSEEK